MYDQTTGRYTQPDPLGMPDGPARYAYAGNSPLMNVDPDGRNPIVVVVLGCLEIPLCAALTAATFAQIGLTISAMMGDDSADDTPTVPPIPLYCPPPYDPCKGLKKQLAKHQQKLQDYIKNPAAHDNLGLLIGATPEQAAVIISGRIAELQSQIAHFAREVKKCEMNQ